MYSNGGRYEGQSSQSLYRSLLESSAEYLPQDTLRWVTEARKDKLQQEKIKSRYHTKPEIEFPVSRAEKSYKTNRAFISTTLSGQVSLRRNGTALTVNKKVWNAVLGCNLKNDRMICLFPR